MRESFLKQGRSRRKAKLIALQDRPEENKAYRMAVRRLRLTGVGGVALLLVSWQWGRADGPPWVFPLGLAVAVIGLMLRVWATGWLQKNEVLITSGPYRLTRNPLYLGTMLITTGQSLMSDVWWAPVVFPALFLALYWPTIREEAAFLGSRFDNVYSEYAARVPLLMPNLKSIMSVAKNRGETAQEFSWPRVRRCYKGFIANVLMILVYVWLHTTR